MRAFNCSAAYVHWRCAHTFHSAHFDQDKGTDNVNDRVDSADFMKMNFFRADAMHSAFCFGQKPERLE